MGASIAPFWFSRNNRKTGSGCVLMRRLVLWLLLAAILAIAVVAYRSRTSSSLNVEPNAAREIEKAKRR
jgi:hypothetical protein